MATNQKTVNSEETKMSKPIFVGVDDGHYAVKVFTENEKISLPSRALSGRHLLSMQNQDEGFYTTEEGVTYTVSEYLQNYEDTRYREFPKSPLVRVLIHAALRKAGLGGKDVIVTTGLPVSYYYFPSGQKDENLIRGKKENLSKKVICGTLKSANIVSNTVTAEAIAAYVDQLMDLDGNRTAQYEDIKASTVGVIDIGGKTTDCAVIIPGGNQVDAVRSGSSDHGVLQLMEALEARLRNMFDLGNVPPRLVESAIAKGTVKIAGEEKNVTDVVTAEKERLAEQIMSGVRHRIGDGKDLDFILFVGGGSIVMRDQLARNFQHCRFAEDAEYANARGMYKLAKYVYGTD